MEKGLSSRAAKAAALMWRLEHDERRAAQEALDAERALVASLRQEAERQAEAAAAQRQRLEELSRKGTGDGRHEGAALDDEVSGLKQRLAHTEARLRSELGVQAKAAAYLEKQKAVLQQLLASSETQSAQASAEQEGRLAAERRARVAAEAELMDVVKEQQMTAASAPRSEGGVGSLADGGESGSGQGNHQHQHQQQHYHHHRHHHHTRPVTTATLGGAAIAAACGVATHRASGSADPRPEDNNNSNNNKGFGSSGGGNQHGGA